jgi:hypothetical protein
MYREFISETDRDEIIANYGRYGTNTPPHCNETMFHKPGTCAFCDGYYGLNPDFKPASYVSREANGWGGNMAPIVDDKKAATERSTWDQIFEKLGGK